MPRASDSLNPQLSSTKTIGLLDHMGYGNLGDAAIQDAVIANIRKRLPNSLIVGFSFVPDDTKKRHGITSYPITWWYPTLTVTESHPADKANFKSALKKLPVIYSLAKRPLDLVREGAFWLQSYWVLRTLDLLIISGGGQLSELWGGPWSHPYRIFQFSLLTKAARKKLYFLNVGAGPLKHPLSRFFIKCALRSADYRSFRDADSEELVRSLGVEAKTHVYPDPAYALAIGERLRHAPPSGSMAIVGLNPFGFCDPRIWPRKDASLYHEYLEKITCFSQWLLDQGYTLRVFTTEMSVDRYAIEDLKARLLSRLVSPDVVSQVFPTPAESVKDLLHQMSQFDYIVTPKFHGIIFSHLLRKPVIALSYGRKMDVAMRAVGQEKFCRDVEHFDVSWLESAFRALVAESASIRLRSGAEVETRAAKLSQQFDGLFQPTFGNPAPTRLPVGSWNFDCESHVCNGITTADLKTSKTVEPLVSIVTPVHNEERHLAECIESILAQTYQNWEYIIVDNCSTDTSLEIARRYAAKDRRIRISENSRLLEAIPNHSRALRQICPTSKYCKVVFGDDWIFPECLERMVALAEDHPSIGLVGAFVLEGVHIKCTGLAYPSTVISGREICRRHFLENVYVFGSANSVLYRSDLVRSHDPFYHPTNIHADTEACFRLLTTSDFGFVHQVLSFTRVRPGSLATSSERMQTGHASTLRILLTHGSAYLSKEELAERLTRHLSEYYQFLAKTMVLGADNEIWQYHRAKLTESGVGFSRVLLAKAMAGLLSSALLTPKESVQRVLTRLKFLNLRRRRRDVIPAALPADVGDTIGRQDVIHAQTGE
jgi:polysaccharide pyruvyl transferase WcaK-like protein/glycosyltransferase involved in cell wall biosynthesis